MNDAVMRAAMDVILQWGPERMTPEAKRLRSLVKSPLSDSEMTEALSEAQRVLSHAEQLAPSLKQGLSAKSGDRTLRDKWPWLTKEQASQAINQGMYFHWRDTGE